MSDEEKPTASSGSSNSESNNNRTADTETIDSLILRYFEQLEATLSGSTAPVPRWGIKDLDGLTGGLHPRELVVIGGRPSTGKSSLLQQVIHVSTFPPGKKVLLFSLDSHRTNVVERLMTREARVDPSRVREGLLTQDEVVALTAAANRLCNRRSCLVIDDTPRPTINYVVSRARKLHDIQEIAFLAIDFVQLIETLPGRENREQEMSIIARSLKALAHELEIPVIAVSQLNRMSTGRDTARSIPRKPTTWDLRDSGALEDAADTVVRNRCVSPVLDAAARDRHDALRNGALAISRSPSRLPPRSARGWSAGRTPDRAPRRRAERAWRATSAA